MKKIFYFAAATLMALLPGGCYEDKGNYDYTDTGSVTIAPTSGLINYSIRMGDRLEIPMTVTADGIEESELNYIWEMGEISNPIPREIPDTEGMKDFDRTVGPDEFFSINGMHFIRLVASWKVGNDTRLAYSAPIRVTITGLVGLIVLHGDDTQSDVGMIVDGIFQIRAGTQVTTSLNYDLYSAANEGAKVEGKGVTIQQMQQGNSALPLIMALTDRTAITLSQGNFAKIQNYEDLFYSVPGFTTYHGKPERIDGLSSQLYVLDDGQLFFSRTTGVEQYYPKFAMPLEYPALPNYDFSANMYKGAVNMYCYDENEGCFVGFPPGSSSTFRRYPSAFGPFNLDDMNADLLYLGRGGFGVSQSVDYVMGVFRDREDGKVYLGEMNFMADGTENNAYSKFKYDDLSNLPSFESARFYATSYFSSTMCYYATDDAVYQFAAMGPNGLSNARKLMMGTETLPISGEITMMKVIPSIGSMSGSYQHSGKMLLVGTYDNGVGTLHALVLNTITGMAESHKTFTGFERIYDANIKFD